MSRLETVQPEREQTPGSEDLRRRGKYALRSNPMEGALTARRMKSGSPGRTRTCDKAVNSRLLYQLSYRGTMARAARV